VLIPGAGGTAWYWHRVVPLLRAAGHEATAVDLLPGGHLIALSQPEALANYLLGMA
jgi:hypothetical protein